MTISNLLLCPYNDFADATLSVNVTLPAGFEADNAKSMIRSDVLRTTDTTTLVITGVWPANRTINSLWLFRHLLHGANWHWQFFSDAGASVAVSGADTGTIPTLCYTPTEPYTWSTGTNDPFQYESPSWFYFGANYTARSFKLTISGTPSAVSYYEIGMAFCGKALQPAINLAFGAKLSYKDGSRISRTDGGSPRPYAGTLYKQLAFEMRRVKEYEDATWMQIERQARTINPMAVSVIPGEGGSRERDRTFPCLFSSLPEIEQAVLEMKFGAQLVEV